jgi:hypothetical protein
MGLPHVLQNAVAKLRAWGRSKRTTDASPRSHRNAEAFTITSQECAVPVAFRQREQWQLRKRSNGPSTSNATSPQMQLPRNVAILVSSPGTWQARAFSSWFALFLSAVMAGHSRSKNGVASLAYDPAIHALLYRQAVDVRHKAGHDVDGSSPTVSCLNPPRRSPRPSPPDPND